MKKIFRFMALILSIIFVFMTVTACGGTNNDKTSESSSANSSAGAQASGTQQNTETRKLRVEVFDRAIPGMPADNNLMTKYVKDNFGKKNNVDVTFVPVPRAKEIDMLNILMAANDAPDICFTYTPEVVYNFVKNNGIYDLGPYLKSDNGKILKDYLTDATLAYGQWDGKQYAIPAKRIEIGAMSSFIRQDWLDKVGMKNPTTFEEFYQVIKAFKDKDPGKLGANNIPFAMDGLERGITWSAGIILDASRKNVTEEQLATYPEYLVPGVKEGVKFLNKMYNEGLISPNFALDKDSSQYNKDIASGKVGFFINGVGYPYIAGYQDELAKSVPSGLFVPSDPFKNDKGEYPKRANAPAGFRMFVPKTCKDPQVVIDYLAWMTDKDVQYFMKTGKEGVNYEKKVDGLPIGVKANADVPDEYKFNAQDVCIIVIDTDYGSTELNRKAKINTSPKYGDLLLKSYDIANNGAFYPPILSTPIESEASLSATVREKGNELFVRSIMCKPDQFDATYDKYLKEYMSIGGQTILDEKTAAWKKEHK